MQISIKDNFPAVQAQLDQLRSDLGGQILASAINKTLEQGRTQMKRGIASEFNVSASYVLERLRIRRASSKGKLFLEGALIGTGKRSANIIAFVDKRKVSQAQQRKRAKAGTAGQLFFKIKRSGSPKPVIGAFIGNQGRTVFRRKGKARLPIEPIQTVDVPSMFNTKRINKVVVDFMLANFERIFAANARFYLSRFGR